MSNTFTTLGQFFRGFMKAPRFLLWLLTITIKRLMLLGTLLGAFALLLYFGYSFWRGEFVLSGFCLISAVILVHLNIILNKSMEE